jgi:uncharacterized membrane protein (UPF0136 family)
VITISEYNNEDNKSDNSNDFYIYYTTMDHPSWTLSGLCALGGIIGYSRKRSMPSLVAGIAFSGLYGAAGYLLRQNADWGLELALGTSSTLLIAGFVRSSKAQFKKPVPNLLFGLGTLSTGYYIYKYNQFYPFF